MGYVVVFIQRSLQYNTVIALRFVFFQCSPVSNPIVKPCSAVQPYPAMDNLIAASSLEIFEKAFW